MPTFTPALAAIKPQARSRLSNGSALLAGVDGRSTWARRLRDLIQLHIADLGGANAVSAAEASIVRRAAVLSVELETMEGRFAQAGQASADDLDLYQRTAGNLRRLLESVGLERRQRDVTPSLQQYLARRAAELPAHASNGTTAGGVPPKDETLISAVPARLSITADDQGEDAPTPQSQSSGARAGTDT